MAKRALLAAAGGYPQPPTHIYRDDNYQMARPSAHTATPPNSNNNMDDANLLLSIGQMHSCSNDDSSYSYSAQDQPGYLQNDDSYSNSEFNTSYPYSTENSNGAAACSVYSPYNSNTSTPIRGSGIATPAGHTSYLNESYSKSSTPHNFKILKKRISNISQQNDDSMCSLWAEQNSFYSAENDDELKQRRLDKALATIQTHLAKPALDPFNIELCKAFLTKMGFPSREHSDTYKIVNTPISKLFNAKVALLANIPFQIEREVGRGSYGSVFK